MRRTASESIARSLRGIENALDAIREYADTFNGKTGWDASGSARHLLDTLATLIPCGDCDGTGAQGCTARSSSYAIQNAPTCSTCEGSGRENAENLING